MKRQALVLCFSAALGTTLCIHPSYGQGMKRGAGATRSGLLSETRFLEAMAKSEWRRARKLYEDEFLPRHPKRAKTEAHQVRYAKACSKLRKKDQEKARGVLERVIQEQPRQLEALLLLAVLEAERGELESSKELLLRVAETGYNPLSEIHDKGSPLSKMSGDSLFILDILKAQRRFELPEAGISTIFRTSEEEKGSSKEKKTRVRARKVSERISALEDLLDSLEKALEAKKEASSAKLFEQFVLLMQRSRPLLSDIVIIRFENRLRRYQGLFLTLKFQVRRSKGIVILRSLERASRGKKFDEVVKLFHSMTILVNDLRAVEHDSFQRLAEVLSKKALTFKVKAEKKKLIAELSLNVTGIILDQRRLDSRGHKNHRAIINDKIYKAGDEVTDKRGEPVRGLRVVDIEKGTVRFRFHQEDFVRVLLAR